MNSSNSMVPNVWRRVAFPLLALAAISCHGHVLAQDRTKIEGIKFSKAELDLLKRIDQIQSGARLIRTILAIGPFVQLLSSPRPEDVAITISTTDFEQLYGAMTAVNKIASCKTEEAFTNWISLEGNQYATDKSEDFFARLESQASRRCTN